MSLHELLISAGGIGIVVKLVMDIVKALTNIKGRTTQALALCASVGLAVFGAHQYLPNADLAEAIWVGLQAGAAAIGIDQVLKKDV